MDTILYFELSSVYISKKEIKTIYHFPIIALIRTHFGKASGSVLVIENRLIYLNLKDIELSM